MKNLKIIITEDGSHSLYNEELNESYHSFHGAMQESQHVFIEKGLRFWRTKEGLPKNARIFEVGFGTGLNALLTLQFAQELGVAIQYDCIEAVPLEMDIIDDLNYTASAPLSHLDEDFKSLHQINWNESIKINELFQLKKVEGKLEDLPIDSEIYDLIFFDAFAPNKQAELWSLQIMENCFKMLNHGGVFVTYSAKGQLKRDLKTVGFEVETVPGPPGKKEMVRAIKP